MPLDRNEIYRTIFEAVQNARNTHGGNAPGDTITTSNEESDMFTRAVLDGLQRKGYVTGSVQKSSLNEHALKAAEQKLPRNWRDD